MTLHFRVFLSKDSSEIFYQKTAGLFASPGAECFRAILFSEVKMIDVYKRQGAEKIYGKPFLICQTVSGADGKA